MDDQNEPLPPAPLNGAGQSAPDEDAVLRDLYGPPDDYGIYRAVGT